MQTFQKAAGVSSLLQALIYISAFIYFGVFWQYPVTADTVSKLAYLVDNQLMLSVVYLVMYVLFGVLLAILVIALHHRLKEKMPLISQLSAVFGVVWVGLVIASGMLINIGLASVVATSEPESAMTLWRTIKIIVEGIGGGNEVVGGLWVLLLSVAALKSDQLSKLTNYLGLLVGSAGLLTLYPAEVFTEIFGLSQIIWFIVLGVNLLFTKSDE
ncbi:hypothetical protein MED121_14319 [Marinomonas sp. MED121]|uniref:DUF4386 family protein n=1 Tax=Marinomonas sp. MED121 TaxID=314277 RepID=UPI00006911F9|nr:DUF4386 family protein [Marinomonas sp. MED121]EAQ67109.1 hypothetical protein MED121_14319 [Marinomonas sp. MED121]